MSNESDQSFWASVADTALLAEQMSLDGENPDARRYRYAAYTAIMAVEGDLIKLAELFARARTTAREIRELQSL